MPEPMVTQEGTENNAGARHAATRCVIQFRQDPLTRKGIVTEDSLRANAPHLTT
jgi:hypothetical protein